MRQVEVDEVIYNTYRRSGWSTENNSRSFFAHEIQFSALVGGEDGNIENFCEFNSASDEPAQIITKKLDRQSLAGALDLLDDNEKKLTRELFFEEKTECELSAIAQHDFLAAGWRGRSGVIFWS